MDSVNDIIQTILLVAILGWLIWQQKPPKHAVAPRSSKLIVDSCGLIDGRIIALCQSGFIRDELVVPEFILHELQMLADGSDAHKRERARYGLDVVKALQATETCGVTIDQTDFERQPNDDKLIALSLRLGAALYTTDFNLSKLAEIKGIIVLNINQLAQDLRPTKLPGEKVSVKILQKGSSAKQGVGYLDDGTMMVVEGAVRSIGQTLEAEITRNHQTVSGKMLFGTIIGAPQSSHQSRSPSPQSRLASRLRKPNKL